MGETTGISWTTSTWNPVTGCSKISAGCDHCYAEKAALSPRRKGGFPHGFDIHIRTGDTLLAPQRWKTPRMIFVNSMSDLFHKEIPEDHLLRVWDIMLDNPLHTYQILTKRPHVMLEKIQRLQLPLPEQIWLGVSVEQQKYVDNRIPPLLELKPHVAFLSCEPLLEGLDLSAFIDGLQWVIVGGESGVERRPMDYEWVREIRDLCVPHGIPFFYKQGNHSLSGRDNILDGQRWLQFPGVVPLAKPPVEAHQPGLWGIRS